MKQLGGNAAKTGWSGATTSNKEIIVAEHNQKLNNSEWDETKEKLATAFGVWSGERGIAAFDSAGTSVRSKNTAAENHQALPIGKLSSLQEDETRYYTVAVVGKANDKVKLATVSWLKEPLHSWLAKAERQVPVTMAAVSANYTLPVISGYSDNSTPSVACWTTRGHQQILLMCPIPENFPRQCGPGAK
jgi:hypothetical protein